jgi:hypothetical protein
MLFPGNSSLSSFASIMLKWSKKRISSFIKASKASAWYYVFVKIRQSNSAETADPGRPAAPRTTSNGPQRTSFHDKLEEIWRPLDSYRYHRRFKTTLLEMYSVLRNSGRESPVARAARVRLPISLAVLTYLQQVFRGRSPEIRNSAPRHHVERRPTIMDIATMVRLPAYVRWRANVQLQVNAFSSLTRIGSGR